MTAPTSDERRALAERLRRASACGEGISCCVVDKALGLRYDDDYFGDVFACESVRDLADLIDPTCRAVHQGTSMDDELVCSECGASLGVEVDDEQRFIPKFCSCCGARVVSGDD